MRPHTKLCVRARCVCMCVCVFGVCVRVRAWVCHWRSRGGRMEGQVATMARAKKEIRFPIRRGHCRVKLFLKMDLLVYLIKLVCMGTDVGSDTRLVSFRSWEFKPKQINENCFSQSVKRPCWLQYQMEIPKITPRKMCETLYSKHVRDILEYDGALTFS